jgi:hypothetical protein
MPYEMAATTPPADDVVDVAAVVSIEYDDLVHFDPTTVAGAALMDRVGHDAFGPQGLGIVAVANVPDFAAKRIALLPLAAQLPYLPDIETCVDAASLYSIGWSHGREALGPQRRPDVAKGSYYVNPFFREDDGSRAKGERPDCGGDNGHDDRTTTTTIMKNVWPASLPQLRLAVLEMSDLLQTVGCLVAKVCDAHCHRQLFGNITTNASNGGTNTTTTSSSTTTTTTATNMTGIEHAIRASRCAKARLLHYFAATPPPSTLVAADGNDTAVVESSSGEDDNDDDDDDDDYDYSPWCAWHNDHVSVKETRRCDGWFAISCTFLHYLVPSPNSIHL